MQTLTIWKYMILSFHMREIAYTTSYEANCLSMVATPLRSTSIFMGSLFVSWFLYRQYALTT